MQFIHTIVSSSLTMILGDSVRKGIATELDPVQFDPGSNAMDPMHTVYVHSCVGAFPDLLCAEYPVRQEERGDLIWCIMVVGNGNKSHLSTYWRDQQIPLTAFPPLWPPGVILPLFTEATQITAKYKH